MEFWNVVLLYWIDLTISYHAHKMRRINLYLESTLTLVELVLSDSKDVFNSNLNTNEITHTQRQQITDTQHLL